MIDDLQYAETIQRGSMVLRLTPAEARSDFVEVSTGFSRDFTVKNVCCAYWATSKTFK